MTQLPLIVECRTPKRGTDCYEILVAMQAGERLTEFVATVKYHITALSQRCGDLRRKYGWPVKSQFIETDGGVKCKEYWIERI